MKSQENQQKYKFMRAAINEAKKAERKNEVPVGAVVVYQNQIISRAHNLRESKQAIEAHAEFLAMKKAAKKIGSWRLEDCDIYVTMEPCPMCAGAMIQSRVRNLFYATDDPKAGVANSMMNIFEFPFNHHVHVESGILAEESKEIIQSFFKKLRNK
ncbi:MAG: nucleoside deaminase [Acholeplasmataceae bacterium]|jgi:tRNA(adenine34) deaminase|nr:nucleoside deaminase [Acholeplasmataceae bacterium]